MSYKTLASKWMKNKELMFLGAAVALTVHFSGVPGILVRDLESVPLGVLIFGAGLFTFVYSLLGRKRATKAM